MAEAVFFVGAVTLIILFVVGVLVFAWRDNLNEEITYEEWLNGTK